MSVQGVRSQGTQQTYGISETEGTGAASSAEAGEVSSLPAPSAGGRLDITAVMIMLERHLAKQSASADVRRDAQEATQTRKEAEVIQKMHAHAELVFDKALVEGFTKMASGAMSMASSSLSLSGNEAGAAAVNMQKAVMEGASVMAAGALERSARAVDTARTQAQQQADAAKRMGGRAEEFGNELDQMAQKTFDRLEQLLQQEQQTRLALIQRA